MLCDVNVQTDTLNDWTDHEYFFLTDSTSRYTVIHIQYNINWKVYKNKGFVLCESRMFTFDYKHIYIGAAVVIMCREHDARGNSCIIRITRYV